MPSKAQPKYPPSPEVDREFALLRNEYLASNHRKKIEIIERAFKFARAAHRGGRRVSGEPYILHPIAVARIVVNELGLGSTSICAALLHDVVEDTDYTVADIADNFGSKIAGIVEGLTKISGGIFGDKASAQADNFRKLLLSMSTDFRVVLVKMADRLHNMRTLGSLRPAKQYKIAGETLYIYAPLAHRLGLFKIKTELEDLAFRHEHPAAYASIMEKISESEAHRMEIVREFMAPVCRKLDEAGFKYRVKARVKSAYSIYNKMEHKKIPFEEIYDIYALRVIFENDDDTQERLRCWEIYTFFSDGHKIHPDRLRDWTSVPKPNGYRALHLTAMGPDGKWIEVQIRSEKMNDIAELGYAAHWKYKTGNADSETELDKWMNTIKEILANPEPNAMDFLDNIKLNLFATEIYVFTPKGDLFKLPSGSTVLDLAFAIHSQLGRHCIAAKINHTLHPLSHRLESGDQVEIITSDTQNPKFEWLGHCHTAKARNALRNILRKDRRALVEHGRHLFEQYLEQEQITADEAFLAKILDSYRLRTPDDFYCKLAADEISLSPERLLVTRNKRNSLIKKLLRNPFSSKKRENADNVDSPADPSPRIADTHHVITLGDDPESEGYRPAPCCHPLPGDDAFGFIAPDGHIEIHRLDCEHGMALKASFGPRVVAVNWKSTSQGVETRLAVEGLDRPGVLHDLTSLLSLKLTMDIRALSITASGEVFNADITLLASSAATLREASEALLRIEGIRTVRRITQA